MIQYLLFSLISSNSEIYLLSNSSGLKILSLLISFLVLFLWLVLIFISIYLTFSSYKLEENEHNKLGDFFVGLKYQKKFKFYLPWFLIRRFIYVAFMIFLVSINSKILIGIISLFQIIYFLNIAYLRPFKEIKLNLIEIMNEIFFFILFCSLLVLNAENDWNTNLTFVYMWVLASNSMLMFVIILSKFLVAIFLVDTVRRVVILTCKKWSKTHQVK